METRAAATTAAAAAPGATANAQWQADAAVASLEQFAAYAAKLGIAPTPAAAAEPQPAPAPAAPAAPAPAPQPQRETRTREQRVRAIAAGSPFPIAEEVVEAALASGQSVEAFALVVACHAQTERTVARILGTDPTPPTSLALPSPGHSDADADAVARRIIAA